MDFKIKVSSADVEICEESYEEGVMDYVNSFSLPIVGEEFDTIEALLYAINDAMGVFSTNIEDYGFFEGNLCTDATVNDDNYQPTGTELIEWSAGKRILYNAYLSCKLTMVPTAGTHTMTDEEAEAFGISSYY